MQEKSLKDEMIQEMIHWIPASATNLLDCACGDGALGAALKEQNPAVTITGITPCPQEAAAAKQVLDQVTKGHLESMSLTFDQAPFDCIICDDVLACQRNPEPVLNTLNKLLHNEGLLLLTLPNLQYFKTVAMLADGRWDYEEEGVMAWKHLRFFTAYEANELLKRCGFNAQRFRPLVSDDPDTVPLNDDKAIQVGRVTIQPRDENDFRMFCTRQLLLIATKGAKES